MCFSNLPVEFDEQGNPYLAEEAEEVTSPGERERDRDGCGCEALEADPEAAYEAIVEAVPEAARESLSETDRDAGTGDRDADGGAPGRGSAGSD